MGVMVVSRTVRGGAVPEQGTGTARGSVGPSELQGASPPWARHRTRQPQGGRGLWRRGRLWAPAPYPQAHPADAWDTHTLLLLMK